MPATAPKPLDKLSLQRIQTLHPKLRAEATQILSDINCSVNTPNSFCRIAFGLRTFQEQQALYNQGRTTPGARVTKAKPGQSMHNYGLAVDIAFIINGSQASWDTKKDWDGDKQSDWMEVVAIFKRYGWAWGGDWRSFVDMPHFEKTWGLGWQDLKKKMDKGDTFTEIVNGKPIKYVNLY